MEGEASLKRFVSEKEVEEARQKRQEEWEKARQTRPNLPAPDEVDAAMASGKTLYEQLQMQKVKKEEEVSESKKFKNMIRGLDDEESEYLSKVSQKQMTIDKNRQKEQDELVIELRKRQAAEMSSAVPVVEPVKKESPEKPKQPVQNKISDLVKQAVKRKPDSSNDNQGPGGKQVAKENPETKATNSSVVRIIGVLPSLVSAYADSDEDRTESSDSDSSTSSSECDVSLKKTSPTGELASVRPSIAPAVVRRIRRELQGDGDD